MEVKPIYLSKTFWLNVVLALSPLLPGAPEFISAHPEVVAMVFAGLNVALRLISSGKVQLW
jgi:hypothetical protein